MGLRDFLNRLREMAGTPERHGVGVTPNEKELEVYKERERKQMVKRELDHYRRKERKEFLQGSHETNLLSQPPTLTTTRPHSGELPTRQKKSLKKHDGLCNQGNLFMK